ncbi:histidinol dehydrogenase [Treponema sp.]|uniref:histidinol dehydrogenase n=1 Tax=Treponema sp. TaxID=166 RepID=UPI00298E4851|nr:histidinol dehydrogenase [Treponema sp.]MCR5613504.1 histidinol dehydrogenase [Treponema sp.]
MMKILYAKDLEPEWFDGRNFEGTNETVQSVITDVVKNGDEALKKYGQKFDVSAPAHFLIPEKELKAAADKLKTEKPDIYNAIVYSHDLAYKFALRQKKSFDDFEEELTPGLFTGQKTIAVDRAGVYVPAGRFPLVSTVIMTVTPAVAAGVKDIVLCTPPRVHPDDKADAESKGLGVPGKPYIGGKPYADEGIMAAAYICGAKKCYACGGSQAIAAMAYGTESIPNVDVIVGPGNKFVAAAKKQVYGKVGIDMVAGPTEVFVIADSSADPRWVAADLLAQAEHDVVAQAVLATPDEVFAKKVFDEIQIQLEQLETKETARASLDSYGRIIITESLEQAAELANRKAPEHLELAMEEGEARDKIQNMVHNYGSLFIGHYAAEVFGDYAAGLNHTLPTSGVAHYSGGLSVRMFLKTVTTLRAVKDSEGMKKSAEAAGFLGDAEGLAAHAKAARIRLEK